MINIPEIILIPTLDLGDQIKAKENKKKRERRWAGRGLDSGL